MRDWYVVEGTVLALTPVNIGDGRSVGTMYPTVDILPATSIRGMVGNYLYNVDKERFTSYHIDDDDSPLTYFKPGMPSKEGCEGRHVPLSLRWCKTRGHLMRGDECHCGSDGKKKSGLFLPELSLEKGLFDKVETEKYIHTKVPILRGRHKGPGANNALAPYSVQAIVEGTAFNIRFVTGTKNMPDVFEDAGIGFGIGGFRSKGYGIIAWDGKPTVTPTSDWIEKRAEALGEELLLTLNSPAIFPTEDERYWAGFDTEILKEEIVKSLSRVGRSPNIEVDETWFDTTHVRGWTARKSYRLTKAIPATAPGSCAKVRMGSTDAAWLELLGLGKHSHVHGDVYFVTLPKGVM